MSKQFFIYTVSLTVLLTAIMYLSGHTVGFHFPLISYLFTWGFALLTTLLHGWLTKTHASDPDMFVSYFMAAVFIKMMFTLVPLFAYLYFYPEEKAPVALSFLVTYFGYTSFETVLIYRKIRKKEN